MEITFLEKPQEALAMAGEYLAEEPILNNVILTLLNRRVSHTEPGRYWIARGPAGPGTAHFRGRGSAGACPFPGRAQAGRE